MKRLRNSCQKFNLNLLPRSLAQVGKKCRVDPLLSGSFFLLSDFLETDLSRRSRRLLKNAHLLRFPHPSSLRRTSKYASVPTSPTRRRGKKSLLIRRDATLRLSGALHLGIFEQPAENDFFSKLLMASSIRISYLQDLLAHVRGLSRPGIKFALESYQI